MTGKILTGLAIGSIVAFIAHPKGRKMISDAYCSITDSLQDLAGTAKNVAEKGKAGAKTAKEAWQS